MNVKVIVEIIWFFIFLVFLLRILLVILLILVLLSCLKIFFCIIFICISFLYFFFGILVNKLYKFKVLLYVINIKVLFVFNIVSFL